MPPIKKPFKTPKSESCIFCGSKDISEEHPFPKWFSRTNPESGRNTVRSSRLTDYTQSGEPTGSKTFEARQSGAPSSRAFRVVCKSCNSGWMGMLQTAAKPILLGIFSSDLIKLNCAQQEILAAWATMFAMVAENVEPEGVGVSQADRYRFKASKKALPNWIIWMGRYQGKSGRCLLYHSKIKLNPAPVPIYLYNVVTGAQVTDFIIGNALLQTFSTDSSALNLAISSGYHPPLGMFQLWPILSPSLDLPTKICGDAELRLLKREPMAQIQRFFGSFGYPRGKI